MSKGADSAAAPLPYGSWPSVIDAAAVAAASSSIGEPRVRENTVYWLESRPTEGGRNTLLCARDGERPTELTPAPLDVRSRVHEYGGGAYLPTPLGVVAVEFAEERLLLIADHPASGHAVSGERVETLVREPGLRCADFCYDPEHERLIMVTERHQGDTEPRNALESLDLRAPERGLTLVHDGHDFYAAPRLAADGRLAFLTWDHPNMPWDGTELRLLDPGTAGTFSGETLVAGGAAESVLQPLWLGGALIFVSDLSGYWNLYRYDASGVVPVLPEDCDYAEPPWGLAMSTVAAVGPRHLVAVRRDDQEQGLVIVDVDQGLATPLDSPWQTFDGLTAQDRSAVFIGGRDDRAAELVRLPLAGGPALTLARADLPALASEWISRPQALRYPTRDGANAFAYYYAPVNPRLGSRPAGAPPLVVMTHGGPTANTTPALRPLIQYFTSRGFAVVDVDYRGSAGYGRAYRTALNGRWGLLDVQDCEDAVAYLTARDLADPRRVVIRGGSAGGFTTLAALTRSRLFAAGASHYGIGDLNALARHTHKFESRYMDALIGAADDFTVRSPLTHVAALSCPVIFFQGDQDRVVPPDQSRRMVAALRDKGLPVAYIEFAGEGHGFRRAANVQRALESEYAFYCRVFGIEPADPLPALEIENL